VTSVILICGLTALNVAVTYFSTIKTVQVSIATKTIDSAVSIASTLDTLTYKRFLANPTKDNDAYWTIRKYLQDAGNKIGALFVYTLLVDNPKVSRGMILGAPLDTTEDDSIGQNCTLPSNQVKLAFQGKTYFSGVLKDPQSGNYLSVGAPIKDSDGTIIGYLGIDTSTVVLNQIGKEVISRSSATIVFSFAFVIVLLIAFLLLQSWYQAEVRKAVGETEQTYQEEFRSFLTSVKSIRHDFINHIHVINGLLEFKHYDKAAEYLGSLMNDVKIVDLSLKVSNPALLVLLQSKSVTAQNKEIEMTFEITEDNFEYVKSTDLIKILSNVIDNALDATFELDPQDRRVKVICRKMANNYIFEVENTGRTISENEKKLIFEQGYTTKTKESEKLRGTGLSIVSEIIRSYSGEIFIDSKNQSTQFRVLIPLSI
jgi:two-component system sensor histidine kinase AgrC